MVYLSFVIFIHKKYLLFSVNSETVMKLSNNKEHFEIINFVTDKMKNI